MKWSLTHLFSMLGIEEPRHCDSYISESTKTNGFLLVDVYPFTHDYSCKDNDDKIIWNDQGELVAFW